MLALAFLEDRDKAFLTVYLVLYKTVRKALNTVRNGLLRFVTDMKKAVKRFVTGCSLKRFVTGW